MDTPKIVVVGSSYSAAAVFYSLDQFLTKTRQPFDLLLISDKNYYVFKDLFSHYLSNSCNLSDISQTFREISFIKPGVSYLQTEIIDIDLTLKKIKTSNGEVKYQYLVLALEKDKGVEDVYSSCDLIKLKNHIIRNIEMAVNEHDNRTQKTLLSFSVVGAQKKGIELACSLSDFVKNLINKQYPELNKTLVKINLIEEKNNISNEEKDPFYNSRIYYVLNKKQISIFTNSRVTKYENNKLVINNEKELYSGTLIFSGDKKYSSLIQDLPLVKDKLLNACVDLYLNAQGYENVFIIGETSKCLDLSESLINTILLFNEQAKICAYNIFAQINNNPKKPIKFNFGLDFISLGFKHSLLEVKGLYFDGYIAWLFQRLVYIWYLLGLKKKIKTLVGLLLNIVGLSDYELYQFEEVVNKKIMVKKI